MQDLTFYDPTFEPLTTLCGTKIAAGTLADVTTAVS